MIGFPGRRKEQSNALLCSEMMSRWYPPGSGPCELVTGCLSRCLSNIDGKQKLHEVWGKNREVIEAGRRERGRRTSSGLE